MKKSIPKAEVKHLKITFETSEAGKFCVSILLKDGTDRGLPVIPCQVTKLYEPTGGIVTISLIDLEPRSNEAVYFIEGKYAVCIERESASGEKKGKKDFSGKIWVGNFTLGKMEAQIWAHNILARQIKRDAEIALKVFKTQKKVQNVQTRNLLLEDRRPPEVRVERNGEQKQPKNIPATPTRRLLKMLTNFFH